MNLTEQISLINNPQDFNKLCDNLFSAIWGEEYQQIDDDQSDGGNDGYLLNKKWLFAKHCFKKLQKKNYIKNIIEKASSDLSKTKKLVKNGLEIKRWYFVTPYQIPNEVFMKIRNEQGKDYNFEIAFIGPSFIVTNLLKNKHLLSEFSFLHILDIDKNLDNIKKLIEKSIDNKQTLKIVTNETQSTKEIVQLQTQNINENFNIEKKGQDQKKIFSKDYQKIIELMKSKVYTPEIIKEIKIIIYSSQDQDAVLQGVLALISIIRPSLDNNDIITFIDIGINTANILQSTDAEAILYAEKGLYISMNFCITDLEGWGRVTMTNSTGFSIITPDEQKEIIEKLQKLQQEYAGLFKVALEKAIKSNNHLALARVTSIIAAAAGQRYLHLNTLGVQDRAEIEKRLCKESFLYAKNVASNAGDEYELTYILHNFANSLRTFKEYDEASALLDEAIKIARIIKSEDIVKKCIELKTIIKKEK